MRNVRLYIGGMKADLDSSVVLPFSYQTSDMENPTAVKNSFSKTITLRGTVANMKIFGGIWKFDSLAGGGGAGIMFNPLKRVDFLLFVDEMIVERGYCQLMNINRKGKDYTFSIGLFGGLGEFFYNLQTDSEGERRSLGSLDYGEDLGFTINAAKVQEVWDRCISGNTPAIAFVPMHNGTPKSISGKTILIKGSGLPQSVTDGQDTYGTYEGYLLAQCERKYTEWEVGDLRSYLQRPALRVKSFIDAICNPINNGGWAVELDSDFFQDANPYYSKSYILLPLLGTDEEDEDVCDDGLWAANTHNISTGTSSTIVPISSGGCLQIEGGNKVILDDYASNAYLTARMPIRLPLNGVSDRGNLYLTNRVSGHTENKCICVTLGAYDQNGNLVGASPRYIFTSKSHRNEVADLQKPTQAIPTTDAEVTGYYAWSNGGYVFRSDDSPSNTFLLAIDNIPRPDGTNKRVYFRLFIQTSPQGIGTLNRGRGGYNSGNVDVTSSNLLLDVLDSGGTLSVAVPAEYASDTKISQEKLFNSLEASPLDILLGFSKRFGLMWLQDNRSKRVKLLLRKNYYTGEVVDVHKRIDVSDVKINPVSCESGTYILKDEYPETTLSEAYINDFGRDYGEVRLRTGYEFGKEKVEMFDGNAIKGYVDGCLTGAGYWIYRNANGLLPSPIAEGMKVTYYKRNGGVTDTKDIDYNLFSVESVEKINSPCLGVACKKTDNEEDAVDVAPAMVLIQGGQMGGQYRLSDDLAIMRTLGGEPCYLIDDSIPIARIPVFCRVAEIGGEVYSLDFGTPKQAYYSKPFQLAPEQALYYRYWQRYLTDLLSADTKRVECSVIFPPHLDMREEMRKFYAFGRSLWVLNKVTDYDASKETAVKCEFVRVYKTSNYTEL